MVVRQIDTRLRLCFLNETCTVTQFGVNLLSSIPSMAPHGPREINVSRGLNQRPRQSLYPVEAGMLPKLNTREVRTSRIMTIAVSWPWVAQGHRFSPVHLVREVLGTYGIPGRRTWQED